jgi:nucleoside deoxyribosyltransferase
MKAYVAGGWFTPEQEIVLADLKAACMFAGYDTYYPKEDLLYVPGKTKSKDVFNENLNQLQECDVVVASTMGKDMGTIFECGYAYSINKPIIYYYPSKDKFNIMLSESSVAVFQYLPDLITYLRDSIHLKGFKRLKYIGEKE